MSSSHKPIGGAELECWSPVLLSSQVWVMVEGKGKQRLLAFGKNITVGRRSIYVVDQIICGYIIIYFEIHCRWERCQAKKTLQMGNCPSASFLTSPLSFPCLLSIYPRSLLIRMGRVSVGRGRRRCLSAAACQRRRSAVLQTASTPWWVSSYTVTLVNAQQSFVQKSNDMSSALTVTRWQRPYLVSRSRGVSWRKSEPTPVFTSVTTCWIQASRLYGGNHPRRSQTRPGSVLTPCGRSVFRHKVSYFWL